MNGNISKQLVLIALVAKQRGIRTSHWREINCSIIKKTNSRGNCNCLLGTDIGAYNTCSHLCKYCYANADKQIVLNNIKKHNPLSPFLVGELEPDDKISEAKQKSWLKLQGTFLD